MRGKNYATGKTGSPIDYITFHAKGRPKVVDGHVQMGSEFQMRDVNKGFEIVASFPELKKTPIIIGESDPEGCAACSVRFNPQNAYRNGTMYSSYTAATFARILCIADIAEISDVADADAATSQLSGKLNRLRTNIFCMRRNCGRQPRCQARGDALCQQRGELDSLR